MRAPDVIPYVASCPHWWQWKLNGATKPRLRPHSHWHEYQLRVMHTSETRTSGAFTVTCTSTNTYNSDAVKNLVKIVKYLHYVEFVAKVYSNIADNVVPNCLHQNYVIIIIIITCLLVCTGCLETRPAQNDPYELKSLVCTCMNVNGSTGIRANSCLL